MPRVDDLFDQVKGAIVFSKIDLQSGYHQIRVKEEYIPKKKIRTHHDHFEFVLFPFGLTYAPTTFVSLINNLFHPYLDKFILIFIDYILIYYRKKHLQIVL